jgi:non-specific serine/threonine protein kinase
LKDVFEVQEEIARSIASALRIQLSPQEEQTIARKPTENPEAYDYLLRGRKYARMANLEFAMQMYQHAIRLDPDFAHAYAGIAHVSGAFAEYQGGDPLWIEKGLRAVERALALQPELPEALSARARLYSVQKNYIEAARWARKAIELKPDCEEGYGVLGRALFESDRWKEAAELMDRAIAVCGDDYNVYIPYANVLRALGDHEAAVKLDERLMAVLEHQLQTVPEDVRATILLANGYSRNGRTREAVALAEKAVAMRPTDSLTLYNAACTYGVLNMKPEALALFRRCVEAGYRNPEHAARDGDLACLHDDPEFKRLIKTGAQKS